MSLFRRGRKSHLGTLRANARSAAKSAETDLNFQLQKRRRSIDPNVSGRSGDRRRPWCAVCTKVKAYKSRYVNSPLCTFCYSKLGCTSHEDAVEAAKKAAEERELKRAEEERDSPWRTT